jgi:hypothetical protein
MTDRKKPTAGFWITVALVAALVGYPLSFGPACWLGSREWVPAEVRDVVTCPYQPLVYFTDVDEAGGEEMGPIGRVLIWYGMLWMRL